MAAAAVAPPPLIYLPMRYITTENKAINSYQKAVFEADINCDSVKNERVEVCAELPHNWEWNPFRGYVYLNLFNDTVNTDHVRKEVNLFQNFFCNLSRI